MPLIAEDLGLITPQVEQLRDRHDLPGMKVLQFAFGDDFRNPYLPHNHKQSSVVYTGTHDNDTTRGWYRGAQEKEKDHVRRYLARDGSDVSWDLIRVAWMSVADLAIAPLQDVLDLGSEARMNFPGRASGNWTWRCEHHQINTWTFDRLAELTWLYGRAQPVAIFVLGAMAHIPFRGVADPRIRKLIRGLGSLQEFPHFRRRGR